MARMTGGQALVKSLRNHGIDTIFGLPGVQLDGLFNALHDEGPKAATPTAPPSPGRGPQE